MWALADRRAALAAMIAIGLSACVANPAPRGWLPPAHDVGADPHGAWIEVVAFSGQRLIAGELLAVERDSLFVLSADDLVRSVAISAARRARIALYDAEWGQLALWSGLGTISTLSHGWFLILSSPVWFIGGSVATGARSRAPIVTLDRPDDWSSAHIYARFPAGLPADLPRTLPAKLRR